MCYAKNPWICNGHGMKNVQSTSVHDQCFCGHGYFGCDCSVRNTQENQQNDELVQKTCSAESDDDDADSKGYGQMPVNEDDIVWDDLGLLNVTMQIDHSFEFENILKTLRLWIAINAKIKEENVWIEAVQPLTNSKSTESLLSGTLSASNGGFDKTLNFGEADNTNQVSNYSISLGFYDDQNSNQVEAELLIKEFHFLFNYNPNQYVVNDNKFVLYDVYNIKEPISSAQRLHSHSLFVVVLSAVITAFFCTPF